MQRRTAFFVSDRTGITAETMGLSLVSQFDQAFDFHRVTLPFIDTAEKALEAKQRIQEASQKDGSPALVFATIINPEVRAIIKQTEALLIDFFGTFIAPIEKHLGADSSNSIGKIHGVKDTSSYNTRIDSVNFALDYDDGSKTKGYESADVILVGVSRCGKTPTSLYLAMHYGVRAANYPLTIEDMDGEHLPKVLRDHRKKLFGLTIDAKRLHNIREERKPNSQYSNLKQCQKEVKAVESLFKREHVPFLSSTNLSIEELATRIMAISGIERRLQ